MNYHVIKNSIPIYPGKTVKDEGFQLTLSNGVLISVTFSFSSYSDKGVTTAEVAVIDKDDNWYVFRDGELYNENMSAVNANITPNELAEIMFIARAL